MKKERFLTSLQEVQKNIVGLKEQTDLIVRSVLSGIPVMLEGESGTGKTEIAKTVAAALGIPIYRVDGNQEVTATKIQGWFDPPMVLEKGYGEDSFIPGPLALAMKEGGLFFFNEATRAPSEALNAVLTALDERVLHIPRLKPLAAHPDFMVILTMNPVDHVGTNPLPRALYDRCVWVEIPHLPLEEACRIVELRTMNQDAALVRVICRIIEMARHHPDVMSGGSVRTAIHMSKLLMNTPEGRNCWDPDEIKKSALACLARNIKLKYDVENTAEDVITEVVEEVLGLKKA